MGRFGCKRFLAIVYAIITMTKSQFFVNIYICQNVSFVCIFMLYTFSVIEPIYFDGLGIKSTEELVLITQHVKTQFTR